MKDYIVKRVIQSAEEYAEGDTTIRALAKKLGVSKSTTAMDLTRRLPAIEQRLYFEVYVAIQRNTDERAIRGGQAKRRKYKGA
jgi:putative DeoR family transcriptional regulator (stage III sporulation protein D)